MFQSLNKYPCPCCGHLVNRHPPGYHEVCPICGWEDDLSQLRFLTMPGGANQVSLVDAQKNFAACGAATRRRADKLRPPQAFEQRDEGWRPINPDTDNIEEPRSGEDYATSYPQDTTVLYYWRSTYWRRVVG
jgi:hypothetical protein